jgi:hypothetical protein
MEALTENSKLESLAKKYIWWEKPEWAYNHPEIFLANLMNLGKWEDIQLARNILGDALLKQALLEAPPGYFNYRSWDYWHLKFDISPIPPLPQRKFL